MNDKNARPLVLVTAAFIIFMSAFFIGRESARGTISISARGDLETQTSAEDALEDLIWVEEEEEKGGGMTIKVNINTADADVISKNLDISDKIARNVVYYREKYGDFEKIEEICAVSGISDAVYERIKGKICVD